MLQEQRSSASNGSQAYLRFQETVTKQTIQDLVASCNSDQNKPQEVHLRNCKFDKDAKLTDLCGAHIEIPKFFLDYSDINGKLGDIGECLVHCNIKSLSMIQTKLTEKDFYDLLRNSTNAKLERLILMHVVITPKGMEAVARLISLCVPMDKVVLRNCKLNDAGLIAFRKHVKKARLDTLNLSLNDGISPSGMECVKDIVENCGVNKLLLVCCCLTDEHLKRLSGVTVSHLSLASNLNIFDSAVIELIETSSELRTLDLKYCEYDFDETERIKRAGRIHSCEVIIEEAQCI